MSIRKEIKAKHSWYKDAELWIIGNKFDPSKRKDGAVAKIELRRPSKDNGLRVPTAWIIPLDGFSLWHAPFSHSGEYDEDLLKEVPAEGMAVRLNHIYAKINWDDYDKDLFDFVFYLSN